MFSSEGLMTIGTAVAGVLIYILAPYLPSLLPAALTRLIGFVALCFSALTLRLITEGWGVSAIVGGVGLAVMIVAHVWQTRHEKRHESEEQTIP